MAVSGTANIAIKESSNMGLQFGGNDIYYQDILLPKMTWIVKLWRVFANTESSIADGGSFEQWTHSNKGLEKGRCGFQKINVHSLLVMSLPSRTAELCINALGRVGKFGEASPLT